MTKAREPIPPELLQQIADAIQSIRFGSIQLTIHDSRVVQIEKAEKVRVNAPADLVPGGRHAFSSHTD
ncbi:MAG: YezD family protein [Candidatus Omnitrophica bacterium]|nr:YezD family protein [Candidatus Omnitrophota bacterium]